MHVEKFDPHERIVWVRVRLFGPIGSRRLRFVLDTGTPVTVVSTSAVDELGYSARMGTARSRLVGVDGVQEGYRLEVERVEVLGLVVERCEVLLPPRRRLALDSAADRQDVEMFRRSSRVAIS